MTTATETHSPIRCWIGNLSAYNSGYLVGNWYDIDGDTDWESIYEDLHIPTDEDGCPLTETFCADWECDIPGIEYSEYPDYDELAKIADAWDDLEDYEKAVISVRMDWCGQSFEEALDNKDDSCVWSGCENMTDVAREFIEGCGMLEQCGELKNYIDYESYGEMLGSSSTFVYSDITHCMIEIFN